MKADDITALVELFAASGWDDLHLQIDGLQLFLSTNPKARLVTDAPGIDAPASPMVAAPNVAAPAATPASQPVTPPHAVPAATAIEANWTAVRAPHLGTFYRSPKPGAPAFVELGQTVSADTQVCLLEVMKLFTALTAGVTGVVRQICAQDGELIEGEQVVFYIEQS